MRFNLILTLILSSYSAIAELKEVRMGIDISGMLVMNYPPFVDPCRIDPAENAVERMEEIRDAYARILSGPDLFVSENSTDFATKIAKYSRHCVNSVAKSGNAKNLNDCMERLFGVADELSRPMAKDLEVKFLKLPAWLEKDEKLLSLMNHAKDVEAAREYIAENVNSKREKGKEIQAFLVNSNVVPGTKRLLLVDPDDGGLVKWIAVQFLKGGNIPRSDNLAVVSFSKSSKLFYMGDISRKTFKDDIDFNYHRNTGGKTCVSCHMSGPYGILEEQLATPEHKSAWRKAMNFRTGDLTAAMEDGKPQAPEKYGPLIGQYRERDEKFFRNCFNGFREGAEFINNLNLAKGTPREKGAEAEWSNLRKKLANNMNCVSCHDGKENPAGYDIAPGLRYPFGRGSTYSDHMSLHIQSGEMPKDTSKDSTTKFERQALGNCLTYEQYGFSRDTASNQRRSDPQAIRASVMYKWLTNVSCKTGKPTKPAKAVPTAAPALRE